MDNTIDMITSDHNPIDIEHKKWNLTWPKKWNHWFRKCFGTLMTVSLEKIIEKLTVEKEIFQIERATIKEGAKANMTYSLQRVMEFS
jgi:dihydroorotase